MNLRLLQISDSALPVGGYTHSWGLEAALARGLVRASLAPPSIRAASREMGELLLALAATWDWSRGRPASWSGRGAARRAGDLVFRERFCWRGPWDEEQARWHLGGRRPTGSLFVTGAVAPGAIQADPGCDLAVLPTEAGDTCLRWCGPPAAVVRAAVVAALGLAWKWTGGEESRPDCWARTTWRRTTGSSRDGLRGQPSRFFFPCPMNSLYSSAKVVDQPCRQARHS
jgi:hypothetical protein